VIGLLLNLKDIEEAVKQANEADLTILVLGENSFRHDWKNKTTGENIDRATLQLSGKQLKLAKRIKANGKPIIVVYVNGSPIAEPYLQKNAAAIIEAWEPGSFGGQAVAEVLFGEINPSGKLPLTVPRSVGQLQMVYNYKPSTYKHKYHTEKKTPLYPFGYGLSYTSFEISEPKITGAINSTDDKIKVEFMITNSGSRLGTEVVQLYVRDLVSSVTRPVKELKGYQRVTLAPNESKAIFMTLTAAELAFYNRKMELVVEAGTFNVMVGNSSRDKDLKTTKFKVAKTLALD